MFWVQKAIIIAYYPWILSVGANTIFGKQKQRDQLISAPRDFF